MKGQQKPKKLAKKAPQKTLKEQRAAKAAKKEARLAEGAGLDDARVRELGDDATADRPEAAGAREKAEGVARHGQRRPERQPRSGA